LQLGGELLKKGLEKQENLVRGQEPGWEQSSFKMLRGSPMLQNGVKGIE
jgi:hypothetical protein